MQAIKRQRSLLLFQNQGFTLIELLLMLSVLSILWHLQNLSFHKTSVRMTQRIYLETLKQVFEEEIIFANITNSIINLSSQNQEILITGNQFKKSIPTPQSIIINTPDHKINLYPKQVCSPASISTNNPLNDCRLILSLRCRLRIQC